MPYTLEWTSLRVYGKRNSQVYSGLTTIHPKQQPTKLFSDSHMAQMSWSLSKSRYRRQGECCSRNSRMKKTRRGSKGSSNPRSSLGRPWQNQDRHAPHRISKGSSNPSSALGESHFSKGLSNPRFALNESHITKGSSNPRSVLGESRFSKGSSNPRSAFGEFFYRNLRYTRFTLVGFPITKCLSVQEYKSTGTSKTQGPPWVHTLTKTKGTPLVSSLLGNYDKHSLKSMIP